MLIQFTCKTASTVSMHENDAKRMLKLMNQSGKIPSALQSKDAQKALDDLQQGLSITANKDQDSHKEKDDISLNTRAYPLIQLLKHAAEKEEYVMWDYESGLSNLLFKG
ncbi:MAG: DUF1840 domain-containing protein [Cocleimonas sp.]|nr:DUF1840 domain-containing protein [Cocleimonas sp.]